MSADEPPFRLNDQPPSSVQPPDGEQPLPNDEQPSSGAKSPKSDKYEQELALSYCDKEINFYLDVSRINHFRWMLWHSVTIVAGSIGTFVAAIDMDPWLGWTRSLPVAAATISAGLVSSFAFQKDAFRQGATADLLTGEKVKFLAGARPYDDPDNKKNVKRFVINTRKIIEVEQSEWRLQVTTDQPSAADRPKS